MEPLFWDKFRIVRQIGFVGEREISLGTDTATDEEVLIKRESVNSEHPKLRLEAKVCKRLAGGVGVQKMITYRVLGDYNFLVMSLPYGLSLEELFNVCSMKFTLKTVLMLAFQMIDRIEFMHARSFMHRNISPFNFFMGLRNDENRVYVSNFDMSKPFRDITRSHIPFRENRSFVGTQRFASINALSGFEQSRRDDLESLGYVLMYFLRGRLPWQGIKARTKKEKCEMNCEKKVSVEALCEGYPPEFASYFRYCRSLLFDEEPDYLHLKRIFHDLFIREGFQYDYAFDWKIRQSQMFPSEDGGGHAGAVLESALEHLNFTSL